MPPHTRNDVEWPMEILRKPTASTTDHSALIEALAFLLELGHYICDNALIARLKDGKGTFQPLIVDGSKKSLAPEVESSVACRVYSIYPQFPDDLCPLEFRPFKRHWANHDHVITDTLILSFLSSLKVTNGSEELKKALNAFINILLRRKRSVVHHHAGRELTVRITDNLSASSETPEDSERFEYQVTTLNRRLLQLILPTIGLGHHNIYAKNIDRNIFFDAIRSVFDSLGILASTFDIPLVAFLADSNIDYEVDGKPVRVYCADYLGFSEAFRPSRCIDDMKRYFTRYILKFALRANYQTITPEDFLWIKSNAFKSLHALSLSLTPVNDFTDIEEDHDIVIEELHQYLLETYKLREGCENATVIPWRVIIDDMADGNETYVEMKRLPIVRSRGHEIKLILQPPDALPTSHRTALALYILKGERGLLPHEKIFSWTKIK